MNPIIHIIGIKNEIYFGGVPNSQVFYFDK
jgi:hypothetical protein